MTQTPGGGSGPFLPIAVTALNPRGEPVEVSIDEYGILRYADHWVALAPAERTVMAMLLEAFGHVVSRTAICLAVWPDEEPNPRKRTIDVILYRVRKRIEPFGLAVATIRRQGFILDWPEHNLA